MFLGAFRAELTIYYNIIQSYKLKQNRAFREYLSQSKLSRFPPKIHRPNQKSLHTAFKKLLQVIKYNEETSRFAAPTHNSKHTNDGC